MECTAGEKTPNVIDSNKGTELLLTKVINSSSLFAFADRCTSLAGFPMHGRNQVRNR